MVLAKIVRVAGPNDVAMMLSISNHNPHARPQAADIFGGGNDYNMLFHLTTEKVLALSKQLFGGQLPVAPCPWLRVWPYATYKYTAWISCKCLLHSDQQWRTQKNFIGGVSFSGIWWTFVLGVRSFWRNNLTSYSCFQTNVLAKFVDKICIFFYTHSPYFMCHCTEYEQSVLQVAISEENKLNATTQQFITAKISGCALKQGSKTHSSLRQSNLQQKNQAALMSCRIGAVEHRMCTPGLSDAQPGLQDRILLNYTRIWECA